MRNSLSIDRTSRRQGLIDWLRRLESPNSLACCSGSVDLTRPCNLHYPESAVVRWVARAPIPAPRHMPACDVAERQRRAEGDAGAGIVAAHDARHVVAHRIEPGDHVAIGGERAGVSVG